MNIIGSASEAVGMILGVFLKAIAQSAGLVCGFVWALQWFGFL